MKNNEELNKKRGFRLSQLRKEKGIKQELLAMKCNCCVQLLSGIENGKKVLTTDRARDFSNILGVRMEYLLCEDDYKTSRDKFNDMLEKNMKVSDSVRNFYNEVGIYTHDCLTVQDKEDETSRLVTHFIMKYDNEYRKITTREYLEFEKKLCDYAIFEFQHMGKPYKYDD